MLDRGERRQLERRWLTGKILHGTS
jgi:hypothetical protein